MRKLPRFQDTPVAYLRGAREGLASYRHILALPIDYFSIIL